MPMPDCSEMPLSSFLVCIEMLLATTDHFWIALKCRYPLKIAFGLYGMRCCSTRLFCLFVRLFVCFFFVFFFLFFIAL